MTDFYVKTGGDDGAAGTSDGTAWATISKVNGSSFAAGDRIFFNKGDIWRETLTFPSSGSAGNLITIGAYGTGDNPIICGADAISSWTAEAQGGGNDYTGDANMQGYWYFENNWTDGSGKGNTLTASATPPTFNSTTKIQGGYSSAYVKASSESASRTDANLSAAFPGKNGVAFTSVTMGAWVQFATVPGAGVNHVIMGKYDKLNLYSVGNQNGKLMFTINADGGSQNAMANAAPQTDTWYHVVGRWNGSEVSLWINGVKQTSTDTATTPYTTDTHAFAIGNAGGLSWEWDGLIDEAFVMNRALSDTEIPEIYTNGLDGTRGSTNFYYGSIASQPTEVYWDNATKMTSQGTKDNLATGEWYWDAGNSRVYVYDNPSGHTVEGCIRNNGINTNSKAYLALSNITVEKSKDNGVYFQNCDNSTATNIVSNRNHTNGILARGCDHLTLTGCEGNYNLYYGLSIDSEDTNITLTNCVASYNINNGFHLCALEVGTISGGSAHHNGDLTHEGNGVNLFQEVGGIGCHDILITGFDSHDNYGNALDVLGLGTGGNYNITVEHSKWRGSLESTDMGSGIRLDTKTASCIIRYNECYGNNSGGIVVEDQATNNQIYYNLCYGNARGMTFSNDPLDGNVFYNNVCYDNSESGVEIGINGTSSSVATFKNNILANNGTYGLRFYDSTSVAPNHVVDYNCYYGNGTAAIRYNTTNYSTAQVADGTVYGAVGKEQHGKGANPLFTNAGAADFSLQAGSPCINAGVNVGLTHDFLGKPIFNKHSIGAIEYWITGGSHTLPGSN